MLDLVSNILILNHHSIDSPLLSSQTGDILHLVPPNALNYWEIKVEDWETLKLKNLEHANSNAWLINETHARKCVSFGTRKWVPTRTGGRYNEFFGGRGGWGGQLCVEICFTRTFLGTQINEAHARKCVSFGTRKWVPTRTSGRQNNVGGREMGESGERGATVSWNGFWADISRNTNFKIQQWKQCWN